jgi:hypothetical protein
MSFWKLSPERMWVIRNATPLVINAQVEIIASRDYLERRKQVSGNKWEKHLSLTKQTKEKAKA